MARIHDLKTPLSFLVFGSASVFIITMDITMREHREKIKQDNVHLGDLHFVNSGILDSPNFNTSAFGEACSDDERRQAYLATCAKRRWRNRTLPENRQALQNILYNDDKKIIFCSSPALLSDLPNNLTKTTSGTVYQGLNWNNMKSLAELSPNEVKKRSRQYRKFILVRHPLHEIAAVVGNKCAERRPSISGPSDLGSINPEEQNSSSAILGAHCGLDDFQGVLQATKSFFDLCRPCDIGYDYVLRAETFGTDMDRFSESSVPVPATVDFIYTMIGSKFINTDHAVGSLLEAIQYSKSGATLKNFVKDFDLFGYSMDKKNRIKCELKIGNKKCC